MIPLSDTMVVTYLPKAISVGRNFCVHTPVCHASWVLKWPGRGTQARFLSASSCILRTANFVYLSLHTPQALASSSALFHCRPPSSARKSPPPCCHRCVRDYQFLNATWKGGSTGLLLIVGGSAVWLGEMAVLEGDKV